MTIAKTAAATIVNTTMVVSGIVTGTISPGMTIVGPGVPAGVRVVSGPGGTGSYVVTASAANVTTPEALQFYEFWSADSTVVTADSTVYTADAGIGQSGIYAPGPMPRQIYVMP
jgi:hypothetical protein